MNRVILIGNLGQDPKVETKNGITYARISLGVNEYWRDRDGNKQERTDWLNVIAFGKLAVNLSHLAKGAKVGVEGKLRSSTYEKNGEMRYAVDLHAERVEFLTPKRRSNSTDEPNPAAELGEIEILEEVAASATRSCDS